MKRGLSRINYALRLYLRNQGVVETTLNHSIDHVDAYIVRYRVYIY